MDFSILIKIKRAQRGKLWDAGNSEQAVRTKEYGGIERRMGKLVDLVCYNTNHQKNRLRLPRPEVFLPQDMGQLPSLSQISTPQKNELSPRMPSKGFCWFSPNSSCPLLILSKSSMCFWGFVFGLAGWNAERLKFGDDDLKIAKSLKFQ